VAQARAGPGPCSPASGRHHQQPGSGPRPRPGRRPAKRVSSRRSIALATVAVSSMARGVERVTVSFRPDEMRLPRPTPKLVLYMRVGNLLLCVLMVIAAVLTLLTPASVTIATWVLSFYVL
jgi:hypothetical protein